MRTLRMLLLPLLAIHYVHHACAHGRLRVPPARNTLWRENKDAPVLYTDNELNCGGLATQHEKNNGKCGVCGDAYDDVRPRFVPPDGSFAKGIIGRCYLAGTPYIPATVELTATHEGYFDFRLCANNDFRKPVTQDCLDKTVLLIQDADGVLLGTRYNVTGSRPVTLEVRAVLPAGVTCTQCVLQWRYVAGNTWGCNNTGQQQQCGLGYGPQETFINCADIAITDSCKSHVQPQQKQTSQNPNTDEYFVTKLYPLAQSPRDKNCTAVGVWASNPDRNDWCTLNCRFNYCPTGICECTQ